MTNPKSGTARAAFTISAIFQDLGGHVVPNPTKILALCLLKNSSYSDGRARTLPNLLFLAINGYYMKLFGNSCFNSDTTPLSPSPVNVSSQIFYLASSPAYVILNLLGW